MSFTTTGQQGVLEVMRETVYEHPRTTIDLDTRTVVSLILRQSRSTLQEALVLEATLYRRSLRRQHAPP